MRPFNRFFNDARILRIRDMLRLHGHAKHPLRRYESPRWLGFLLLGATTLVMALQATVPRQALLPLVAQLDSLGPIGDSAFSKEDAALFSAVTRKESQVNATIRTVDPYYDIRSTVLLAIGVIVVATCLAVIIDQIT